MTTVNLILSTYVLNALWQIPVIAATAWLCMKFASRLPAKYQHGVWAAALILGVVLPILSLPRPNVAGGTNKTASVHVANKDGYDPLLEGPSGGIGLRGVHRRSQQVTLGAKLQWTLSIVYLAILAYRLLRLAWAWRCTKHLVASVSDISLPTTTAELVGRLARQYCLDEVLVASSRETTSPFITGIRRPILVIPESLLREASEVDLSRVLAHEFAHVKRHDFLLNLVYEIASIPIAFHPIAPLIKQRIEDLRELACDEIAAAETGSRSEYASSLLRIAESISGESIRQQASHVLGLFETDNLEERIMSLLARKKQIGESVGRIVLGVVGAVFAAVCLGMSGFALQVSAATSQAYSGTWRGDYKGQNFIVIRLNEVKGQIHGAVQMRNTQIDLEGGGEVYQVSGNLSEPMNLSDIRFDGKALLFQFLEEGDTEPVHWRMELNSPEMASLYWVELPQDLKFKPIRLAKDAGNNESMENDQGTRSTIPSATQKVEYILGDLKIEGDVHDRDAVRDRILKQLAGQEFGDVKDLVAAVAQRGVRSDLQNRGYFKVAVQDPISKPLNESGGKQRILVVVPVSEGAQYRLKKLTIASVPPERSLNIPTGTLQEQFHLRPNDPFSVAEVRAGMERATKLYADHGYPEAQLQPETDIGEAGHQINLIIRVTEGAHKQ
jgi:beta-lactamase regulating signal transducer with metallopeptidase domain